MSDAKLNKKNLFIGIIGALIFLMAFLILDVVFSWRNSGAFFQKNVSAFVEKRQQLLSSYVSNAKFPVSQTGKLDVIYSVQALEEFEKREIALFFYKNDTLVNWTNNDIPVPDIFDSNVFSHPVVLLKNGVFLCDIKQNSNTIVVGLALIKKSYEISNNYINNYYAPGIILPDEANIVLQKTESRCPIYSRDGDFLFEINISRPIFAQGKDVFILFVIFIFFLFFLIRAIYQTIIFLSGKTSFLSNFVFFLLILLLRFIIYDFRIPTILYYSELFRPQASMFFSLGDTFLNILFLLSICFCLRKPYPYMAYRPKRKYDFLMAILFSAFCGIIVYLYLLFVEGVIFGTNLYEGLDNLSKFNPYSLVGLITIAFSALLLYIVFSKLASKICYYSRFVPYFFLYSLIGLFLIGVLWFFYLKFFFIGILFTLVLFILYFISFFKSWNLKSLMRLFPIILILSIFTGFHILKVQEKKERGEREILIEDFYKETEPGIQYFYRKFQEVAYADKLLQKMLIFRVEADSVRNYLKNNYDDDIWDYYDVVSFSCLDFQNIQIDSLGQEFSCVDYMMRKIEKEAIKTDIPGLFLMSDALGNVSYCSNVLEFIDEHRGFSFYLFLQFSPTPFVKDKQYSKLIKSNIEDNIDIESYSYAKYANGFLIKNGGRYWYNPNELSKKADLTKQKMKGSGSKFGFFEEGGYEHLIYIPKHSNVLLIISKKIPVFPDKLKIFSSVFVTFSLLMYLYIFIKYLIYGYRAKKNNFKTRIQISIIFMVMGASILSGAISIYYINQVTKQKMKDTFWEHTNNIASALEYVCRSADRLESVNASDIRNEISRYFNMYQDDITIFNLNGKMLISSSPEIYEHGIISSLAHPTAIKALDSSNKSWVSEYHSDIGSKYEDVYVSIKNSKNEILGYASIFYFSKGVQKELTDFLMTCVNFVALVILLLFFLLIFITNMITKPLLFIRKQLEKYTIGGKKLVWESDDEIGNLVREYNRMIDKLQENTYLAAKIERENGWREMTRQVAHEIKNPLTPMRLSVQQLLKTWRDKAPDFDSRLKRTTQVLIEQIDILSRIANTFLDFSKMPHSASEKVNLIECIDSVIDLYKEDSVLKFVLETDFEECYVIGDKQQFVRVFGNLFRNAEQAIPPNVEGEMHISIKKWQKNYVLRFADNGKGIPDADKHLIFHPHFTTKEDGTGLGLSIVKSIIESFGGRIDFESEENKGTTFIIHLPAID